jgi:hypothetical protein
MSLRSAGGVSGDSERSEANLSYPFIGVPGESPISVS